MTDTILLTGSAGKTATALAELLSPDTKILVASRRPTSPSKYPTAQFDWLNDTTWFNIFSHRQTQYYPITAVYLVVPDLPDARANAIPFVRFCMSHGVRRFVLLSAWENPEGGPLLGGVHAELKGIGEKEGVEWAVLRPHFFMENFTEPYHLDTIRNERKIYSGAGEGRKAFIAARDIAAAAKCALLDPESLNGDRVITGSESLTYSDVAETLSDVLGTRIEHISLDPASFKAKLSEFGLTAEMAEYMTVLDQRVSQGLGRDPTNAVQQLTGRAPQTFRQFAEENKLKWQ